MMRAARAEAFARMLDGDAPLGRHAAEALALSSVAVTLGNLPAPAPPAGLAAGRASFMQAATAHVASAASFAPSVSAGAKVAAGAKAGGGTVTGGKVGILGLLGGHLVPLAAGTAVVAVGAAGIAVGTSRSLPGEPLYGVKRSVEALQVRTAGGPVSTAEEQLAQANTRLEEAAALRQQAGGATHIPGEVDAWVASEEAAVKVLLPLAAQPKIRAELTGFLASQSAGLATMPPASVKAATDALATLAAGLGLAHAVAPTRPSLTNPLSPVTPLPHVKTQIPPGAGLPTSLTTPAGRGGTVVTPLPKPVSSAKTPTSPVTPPAVPKPAVTSSAVTKPAVTSPAGVPSLPTAPSVPLLPSSASLPGGAAVPSTVPTDVLGTVAKLLPTSLPTP